MNAAIIEEKFPDTDRLGFTTDQIRERGDMDLRDPLTTGYCEGSKTRSSVFLDCPSIRYRTGNS